MRVRSWSLFAFFNISCLDGFLQHFYNFGLIITQFIFNLSSYTPYFLSDRTLTFSLIDFCLEILTYLPLEKSKIWALL